MKQFEGKGLYISLLKPMITPDGLGLSLCGAITPDVPAFNVIYAKHKAIQLQPVPRNKLTQKVFGWPGRPYVREVRKNENKVYN